MAENPEEQKVGFRHFYTSAVEGELGEIGFQTIACAPELEAGVRTLESLVRGYRNPDPDEGYRTRQLLQLPSDPNYCVLSTITPTGSCPDGRPGNYWAESVVVPARWLGEALWDADAAFEAMEWWGPEAADELAGWPCHVPPEALPPLEPGTLSRLAHLREALPDRDVRQRLLRALVLQRRNSSRVFVVEGPQADPAALDSLVLRLPLALPPAARMYPRDDAYRVVQLRTRGHLEEAPQVDVQGLPSAHLPQGRGHGVVIDLGGRLPLESVRDSYGAAYVKWLDKILTENDWRKLEDFYRRSLEGSYDDPIASFSEITGRRSRSQPLVMPASQAPPRLGASEPVPSTPISAPPPALSRSKTTSQPESDTAPRTESHRPRSQPISPPESEAWSRRKETWEVLDRAEEESWELSQQFEAELRQLQESLLVEIAEKEKRLHQTNAERRRELEEHVAALGRELREQKSSLEAAARNAAAEIRGQASKAKEAIRDSYNEHSTTLQREEQGALEALNTAIDNAMRAIENRIETDRALFDQRSRNAIRRVEEIEQRMMAPGADAEAPLRAEPEAPGSPPPPRQSPHPHMRQMDARRRPLFQKLSRNQAMGLAGVILVGTLVLGWVLGPFGSPDEAPPEDTSFAAQQEKTKLLDEIQDRLRQGSLAATVLERAGKKPETAKKAAAAFLSIALAKRSIGPGEDCALLQAALNQVEGTSISVDGSCGPGTATALNNSIPECCRVLSWTNYDVRGSRRAVCFLQYYAGHLDQNAFCEGNTWPFSKDINPTEAERAVELFRKAFETFSTSAPEDPALVERREGYKSALGNYDLLQEGSLDLVSGMSLTERDVRKLLRLIHMVVSGRDETKDSAAMTIEELRAVSKLIDDWEAEAGPGADG